MSTGAGSAIRPCAVSTGIKNNFVHGHLTNEDLTRTSSHRNNSGGERLYFMHQTLKGRHQKSACTSAGGLSTGQPLPDNTSERIQRRRAPHAHFVRLAMNLLYSGRRRFCRSILAGQRSMGTRWMNRRAYCDRPPTPGSAIETPHS